MRKNYVEIIITIIDTTEIIGTIGISMVQVSKEIIMAVITIITEEIIIKVALIEIVITILEETTIKMDLTEIETIILAETKTAKTITLIIIDKDLTEGLKTEMKKLHQQNLWRKRIKEITHLKLLTSKKQIVI